MLCQQCGSEIREGEKFCASCGTAVPEKEKEDIIAEISRIDAQAAQAPAYDYVEQPAQQPVAEQPVVEKVAAEQDLPEQYKPLGPWAFFGLQILYCIPLVGFIFLIIHSVSKGNINRRNFARSYWCALLIVAIAAVVFFVLAFVLTFFTRASFGDMPAAMY